MKLIRVFLAMVLLLTAGSSLKAQSKDGKARNEATEASRRFESHPGLLNFVEGDVRCTCGGHGGARAATEPRLIDGDIIQTGDGRAEALLNPGYYLRLSRNSEVVFMDLSSSNLKVKLLKGSAIIEIPIDSDGAPRYLNEFRDLFFDIVTVITPSDEYAVTRPGLYRFEVMAGAQSRVSVLKGAVVVAGVRIKDGHAARVVAGKSEALTEEKSSGDAFDEWSRERALKLVQSNQSLKRTEWYKLMRSGHAYLETSDKDSKPDLSVGTVSALTGGVTFVEKALIRKKSEEWQELKAGSRLMDGDRVLTAPDCRAELAPYPYFYLFLSGNTEIVYSESPEGKVSLKLVQGSIIVLVNEPRAKVKERNVLKLITNNTEYEIEHSGYYRLNFSTTVHAEMLIYQGRVRLDGKEIGASKEVVTTGDSVAQSSLDKNSKDSFNIWTEHRMVRALTVRRRNIWYAGAWFLHPETNEYTFVPGDRHCKSPYGGNYSAMFRVNQPMMWRPPVYREPLNGIRGSSP